MKPKPHQKPLHPGHRQGKAPKTDRCPVAWWMYVPAGESMTKASESHRERQQHGIFHHNGLESSGAK